MGVIKIFYESSHMHQVAHVPDFPGLILVSDRQTEPQPAPGTRNTNSILSTIVGVESNSSFNALADCVAFVPSADGAQG
jgi:hypothetical protein